MTRAIQKIERQYAAWMGCLLAGEPTKALLDMAWQAVLTLSPDKSMADRLRILRQLVFRRLYQLDCEQAAPLDVVMSGMTDLAEFCIKQALLQTQIELIAQYGSPIGISGKPSQLWAVGMGKLGARELNVSSDIDLIFVYSEDGETTGIGEGGVAGKIANHEFFAKQVRMLQSLLSSVTEYGFVFRVDLALRPYGREGALAVSLHSLAQYFQRVGREWERFAWLKSRVLGASLPPLALRSVVRAFVFRRFLDHKVFVALRGLHQLIRQNVQDDRDVKLGRGGIREIEFAAQVLQIVRGGRQPELLTRPTLSALKRLTAAGLMTPESAQLLAEAYDFLRRTEHRIQYLDDQQTHMLPRSAEDIAWVAGSMGFASPELFEAALAVHREQVANIFEQWVSHGIAPLAPTVTIDMLQAKAKWVTQFVRKHPDVADELLRPEALAKRFDATAFKRLATAQYAALQATGLCDEEAILDLLRRAHHLEVFRILVRDVQGLLSVRDVGDELSSLADSMLALTLPWCAAHMHTQWPASLSGYGLEANFAVIAYGKLGGKELGYGSDLDVVFLYDDEDESASQRYTALVRKLISWLTVKTGEGGLYEIDTALRPNGNSGLLVTSLAAYEKYQLQRGSNTAWTWELQAMTRARCVLGAEALRVRFDAIRAQVLTTPRDPMLLRQEIVAMREKLRAAYPAPIGWFDIKHSIGGMLDVEFAVQCLVLTHAKDFVDLIANVGNIELLKIAQVHELLPSDLGVQAANAYQVLRDQQHAARLQEVKTQLPSDQWLAERATVSALWCAVFELAGM